MMEIKIKDVFQLILATILIGCPNIAKALYDGRDGLNNFVLVNTSMGGIEGISNTITLPDGAVYRIDRFLGIPFAESPVGDLRFMKPVRKNNLGVVFKAHEESLACPQSPFILKQWVPGPDAMSEDCLKLNIYVPNGDNACDNYTNRGNKSHCPPKAVMIWIHGGAFLIGQSRIYNGERLAVVGDVIVVTINYRLGPLGFLSTGDGVVRGNAGLWDQKEAISWVHENIAFFGGDPNKITVFGESAGASSAVFQAMFPGNAGKIKRIIASSGSVLCPWSFSAKSTVKYTLRLAEKLSCVPRNVPGFSVDMHQKMISCLQGKSYKEIIDYSFVGDMNETLFRPEFVPIMDGEFISALPGKSLAWNQSPSYGVSQSLKALSNLDVMIGNNYNDGEAIAKISVRNYINITSGMDFDDSLLNPNIVLNIYIHKIMQDLRKSSWGLTNLSETDILSKFNKVYNGVFGNPSISNQTISQRDAAVAMILDMTSDFEFFMPTIQTLSSIASMKLASFTIPPLPSPRRFLFLFDRKYPYKPTFDWIKHASHGDDLPYIFGFPPSMTEAFNMTDTIVKAEWGVSAVIMTYWTNFAKTGNPNAPKQVPTRFEEFDDKRLNYLYITDKMSLTNARQNFFGDRVNLWKSILQEKSRT